MPGSKKTDIFISVLPILDRVKKSESKITRHENCQERLSAFNAKIKKALIDFSNSKQSCFTENPVKLTVHFIYQQKDKRAKRLAAITGGIINLLTDKVVDCLVCTLIAEPAQICEISSIKCFGDEQGVKITIEEL